MANISYIDKRRIFTNQIDEINQSSSKDFCRNILDLKKSNTVKKIILVVSSRAKEILEYENIPSIYEKYIKGEIITSEERENFINFLEDNKNKKTLINILYKLRLLQGNENEEFISNFLKNSEQQLDASKFIDYLIKELRIYKSVINHAKDIKKIGDVIGKGEYYTYQNLLNQKLGLLLKRNNEIFLCDDSYTSVEVNFDDGIVRGVKEINGEDVLVLTSFNGIEFKDLLIIEKGKG